MSSSYPWVPIKYVGTPAEEPTGIDACEVAVNKGYEGGGSPDWMTAATGQCDSCSQYCWSWQATWFIFALAIGAVLIALVFVILPKKYAM